MIEIVDMILAITWGQWALVWFVALIVIACAGGLYGADGMVTFEWVGGYILISVVAAIFFGFIAAVSTLWTLLG